MPLQQQAIIRVSFSTTAVELAHEPSLRELQVTAYCRYTDIYRVGNLFHAHSPKKPELRDLHLSRIDCGKTRQRFIERNDIDDSHLRRAGDRFFEWNPFDFAPSLDRAFFSGIIDQNSSHYLRSRAIKVLPVLPIDLLDIDQFEECFINECGGLQRVAYRLLRHVETS